MAEDLGHEFQDHGLIEAFINQRLVTEDYSLRK